MQVLRGAPDGVWPDIKLIIDPGDLRLDSIGFGMPVAALYAGFWLPETA